MVSLIVSVDRDHFMSMWQVGQTGASNSSNARRILSTTASARPLPVVPPLHGTTEKFEKCKSVRSTKVIGRA